MYRLRKQFKFEASHQLPHHDGKCQRLHGHSWVGYVVVEGDDLVAEGSCDPQSGMLIDYGRISEVVKPLVEQFLDHHHLNETTGLESPTSERLAWWIYQQLKPQLPQLISIVVEETCTSSAEYRPAPPKPTDLPVGLIT